MLSTELSMSFEIQNSWKNQIHIERLIGGHLFTHLPFSVKAAWYDSSNSSLILLKTIIHWTRTNGSELLASLKTIRQYPVFLWNWAVKLFSSKYWFLCVCIPKYVSNWVKNSDGSQISMDLSINGFNSSLLLDKPSNSIDKFVILSLPQSETKINRYKFIQV